MKSHHHLCAQRPASMLQSRITSWFLTKLEQSAEAGQENQLIKWEKTDFFLFVCSVTSSGLCIYSMFRNLWVNDFEKSKRSTRKWKFLIFQISLSLSVFFPLVMHHKPHWGAIFLPATFNLFMGFSRQEYWSGLLFPSPVDHILSELPTMPQPSWVALHTMTHSFIKLDKAVAHVISLISFLWLWLSFCLPFEG